MKNPICTALLALSMGAAPPDPVAWKLQDTPAKPVKAGARFTVKLVAQIQEGWHLYSMKEVADGPIATRIWLPQGQAFQLAGPIQAAAPQVIQDPSFNMEVELYEGEAEFTLPVRIAPGAPAGVQNLVVSASYQSCNNKICLPPKTVHVEAAVTVGKP
jgi:thiol:disulfide interchange protein DsbD